MCANIYSYVAVTGIPLQEIQEQATNRQHQFQFPQELGYRPQTGGCVKAVAPVLRIIKKSVINMQSLRTRTQNDSKQLLVEEREKQWLRGEGPSLGSFRVYGVQSPFSKFIPKNCMKLQPTRTPTHPTNLRLHTDPHSNLRAFYFLLLTSCFEHPYPNPTEYPFPSPPPLPTPSSHLLYRLKAFLMSESVNLEPFCPATLDASYLRILKQNRYAKKLIFEVLSMLASNHSEDVLTVVARFPIVDVLLAMLIRAVVAVNRPEIAGKDRRIESEVLVESLREVFGVKIEANAFEMIYEDQFVIREDNDYTYIKKQLETTKPQSADTTKKTEQSQTPLTNSQFLDKAKLLGQTIPPLLPPIPPLNLNSQPPKIASLCDIRQCSSKRNSFDEENSRKMSTEEGNDSGRIIKPRDVISEIDESCESSQSCVIEKIEFGSKGRGSPNNSRRNSPSKFTKVKKEGLGLQEVKAEPMTKIRQVEQQRKSQFEESPTFPEKVHKKVSQFTITSRGDEQQVECLDEQVKQSLTDGMTSEAVLKFLSPSIAKVMHQKKKQSLLSAMQKYNINTTTSCIRTIPNPTHVDPHLRISCNTNPISLYRNEFEHSDRRNQPKSPISISQLKEYTSKTPTYKSPKVLFNYTGGNGFGGKPGERVTSVSELRTSKPRLENLREKSLSPTPRREALRQTYNPLSSHNFYQ